MWRELRTSFSLFVFFMLLTGLAYPFVVLEIGQNFFPIKANGSLIRMDGRVIGSSLIGQAFSEDGYFHPRPSAAGSGYDASNSSGTNEGPTSVDLVHKTRQYVDDLKHYQNSSSIPIDLVTASASGLDPDISLMAARYQAGHIAEMRHLETTQVQDLINKNFIAPDLGFLGEYRVNVLDLNLALDQLSRMSKP